MKNLTTFCCQIFFENLKKMKKNHVFCQLYRITKYKSKEEIIRIKMKVILKGIRKTEQKEREVKNMDNNVPSVVLMECLNTMIGNYGVKYYSKALNTSCDPALEESNIEGYIKQYALNCYKTPKQRKELPKYFWDDYRPFFGREYDRIICTNSFRRLQYKTQVMVNSASDEQRTRLLHSLEVQRIARKIALGIGANAELAENIAIAHDIGHAPFGHSGEEAISDFLTPKDKDGTPEDFDAHFLHAMQSVKVLDKIATHTKLQKYGIDGLGLSDYVLEGVLKHDSDVFSEKIIFAHVHNQYDVERLCGIVGVENAHETIRNNCKDISGAVYPQVLIGSIESQIVAWADKIAYLGHDWEEFLDTKLLEKLMSRINDMVRKMFGIIDLDKLDEITKSDKDEYENINNICFYLRNIQNIYHSQSIANEEIAKAIWAQVRVVMDKIISTLKDIEDKKQFHYFTEKEYLALKDYFAMVISWVKLIGKYPKPEALKYDPIYIFYMFLSEVRTTVITKAVTEKLISGSKNILDELAKNKCDGKGTDRKDYLLHCNKEWAKIYNDIQNDPDLQSKDKEITKKRKKLLKDSVRSCYLVQFGNENGEYKPDRIQKTATGYYSFDDTYCCLLNMIGCITSQYIGSTRVNFMTQQAKKIVTGLMEYYVKHPEMLPDSQRRRYKKNLKERNDELRYFIADYVGGMTDRMAKKKYDEIMSSDTKWSNEYSSGLT